MIHVYGLTSCIKLIHLEDIHILTPNEIERIENKCKNFEYGYFIVDKLINSRNNIEEVSNMIIRNYKFDKSIGMWYNRDGTYITPKIESNFIVNIG